MAIISNDFTMGYYNFSGGLLIPSSIRENPSDSMIMDESEKSLEQDYHKQDWSTVELDSIWD